MQKSKKVNVLGTEYEVVFTDEKNDPLLKGAAGYCDSTIKKIAVNVNKEDWQIKGEEHYIHATLRHELIHAFLYESGLHVECPWIHEEMIDWVALQFPKMSECFSKEEIL